VNPLRQLLEQGQSYWLDNLTREMIRNGELKRRVTEEGLRGVTSNVFIKIPGTRAGFAAIEEALYEGINVNITLLFSIAHYEAVAEAYLRALERRVEAGRAVDGVASVASFFLSRIYVLVDQLLGHRIRPTATTEPGPRPEQLLGKAAIANAKLAYQHLTRVLASDRWNRLAARGARIQRLLWASTSTKDPRYDEIRYVEPLIGRHTVNTMTAETIRAFATHGVVATTVERDLDDARQVFEHLAAVGIDFDKVTWQLENEGVQKFRDPFDQLMAMLSERVNRSSHLGTALQSASTHEPTKGARR
jgi:transaldolase